jgi:hypothetical protein
VRIDAGNQSVAEAVNQLLAYLHEADVLQDGYQPLAVEG